MNNKFRILLTKIFLHFVMNNPLCTSRVRRRALIICGAKIGKDTFIGQNVYFDPLAIQNISIGEHSYITQNCSILTHFYGADRRFYFGNVRIGDHCFIGMNTLICKPVSIGNNCIVGGAVITKDIPDNVVAAGVPCKIIKPLD
ncbi:MAG: acyltransferase [Spirochaetales bacterium]|nr:acyltransferase [Spirochaetales bacterium]MDY5915461.1 acyltransferase [Treponema sp.]